MEYPGFQLRRSFCSLNFYFDRTLRYNAVKIYNSLTKFFSLISVVDTEWSYNTYEETYSLPWTCPNCELTSCLSPLERLQHTQFICSSKPEKKEDKIVRRDNRPNTKEYKCDICNDTLYLTPVEILKHKKGCKIKWFISFRAFYL